VNEHMILATPDSANHAQRHFPDRVLEKIENIRELDVFLANCAARSILFCADWSLLTVDVSRALASWAMVKPERGSGLFPLADDTESTIPSFHFSSPVQETVFELTLSGVVAYSIDGRHELVSERKFAEECLRPNTESSPAGLVLSGHGAEYCIQFGDKWLSTFETELLSGPFVFPQIINASAIFLNGCSSMRLGDSVVPMKYSLAYSLFTSGATVIGSFRNIHTSLFYGRYFATALLRGQPLGQIVNMLNRFASRESGRNPAFQMLGDPCLVMFDTIRASENLSSDITSAIQLSERIETDHLQNMISHAAWLEHAGVSLKRWLPETEIFSNTHAQLVRAMDLAAQTANAAILAGLQADDIELACSVLSEACVRSQKDILGLVADYIQAHGWIQSAYAPLSRKADIRETSCERCGSAAAWTRYVPYAAHLLSIEREECDRCGTTQERIGMVTSVASAKIVKTGDSLDITLPPLPNLSEGLLFFHKMPGLIPRDLPKSGGCMRIEKKELVFLGRLTLVMLVVTSTGLTLEYHTFFTGLHATSMSQQLHQKVLSNETCDHFH
jgi:hypothetical protein